MSPEPLRSLLLAYGLAAAVAAALVALGAGWAASALAFWLGGAIIALLRAGLRRPVADRADPADDAAEARLLAETLREWEMDRQADVGSDRGADSAPAARRRTA